MTCLCVFIFLRPVMDGVTTESSRQRTTPLLLPTAPAALSHSKQKAVCTKCKPIICCLIHTGLQPYSHTSTACFYPQPLSLPVLADGISTSSPRPGRPTIGWNHDVHGWNLAVQPYNFTFYTPAVGLISPVGRPHSCSLPLIVGPHSCYQPQLL
jgi:hypothetical protein